MQVHFWGSAQVTDHCHLASSSSQFSASWMDCPARVQLFLLAQVLAVQDLHHGLLLRDSLELQAAKVPQQSEELVEMIAAVTAKRHPPSRLSPLEDEMDCFCRLSAESPAPGLSCGGSGGSTGLSGDTPRGAGGMG